MLKCSTSVHQFSLYLISSFSFFPIEQILNKFHIAKDHKIFVSQQIHFFVEKLAKKKATLEIFLKDLEDARARFDQCVSIFIVSLFCSSYFKSVLYRKAK